MARHNPSALSSSEGRAAGTGLDGGGGTAAHGQGRRRRVDGRSKRVKLAAVMAAEMSGLVVASKQTGIPASTIRYWAEKPEFAEIRSRTREELADEVRIVAHLAWKRIAETLPTMEGRDAIFAAEKASTILQLVTGYATERTEHRDITDSLTPEAAAALADEIDAWLKERAGA